MVDDVRARVKVLIDAYDVPANITKDDDSTAASYAVMYAYPDKTPLRELFITGKKYDGIYFLHPFDSEPLLGFDKKAYAYRERVPIEVCTVDKTGCHALQLENKMAQELRRIFYTYAVCGWASATAWCLHSLRGIRHSVKDMGGWNLYSAFYEVEWTRPQENTAPTVPTISYGDDWIYEGDRVAGGAEGTWTLTTGAGSTITQTIDSGNNLYLNQTVFGADSYTTSGTNLSMLTNTYPYIRFRYKTTGDATAKIIVNFSAGTQTVLSETASSTWTTASVALTGAKTVNTLALYCCDGVGTVTYDFVEIYKGNYIFPNTVSLTQDFSVNDAVIPVPSRMGDITQALGTKLMEIRTSHDLLMEYSTVRWTLPQATGTTSYDNEDVLLELLHYEGNTHLWHWLDLGSPTQQFKVRLTDLQIRHEGDGDTAECTWREYRHGSASETVSERFGLTL